MRSAATATGSANRRSRRGSSSTSRPAMPADPPEESAEAGMARLRAEIAALKQELAQARTLAEHHEGEAAGLRYVLEQLRAARQRPARTVRVVHAEGNA